MTDSEDLKSLLDSVASFGRLKLQLVDPDSLNQQHAKSQERMLNQLHLCRLCGTKLKFREMQHLGVPWDTNLYCTECLPKVRNEYTYTCRRCKIEFLSRRQVTLCEQCGINDRKTQSRIIKYHKRISKQAGLPATLALWQWIDTLRYFQGKCAYCQEQPYEELDHFIPTDAGGGTTARNCVPACKACNNAKSNFNPVDPPLHFKTNDIDWFLTPKNMHVPLFEQIKRVAAYLGVPFPYKVVL